MIISIIGDIYFSPPDYFPQTHVVFVAFLPSFPSLCHPISDSVPRAGMLRQPILISLLLSLFFPGLPKVLPRSNHALP